MEVQNEIQTEEEIDITEIIERIERLEKRCEEISASIPELRSDIDEIADAISEE